MVSKHLFTTIYRFIFKVLKSNNFFQIKLSYLSVEGLIPTQDRFPVYCLFILVFFLNDLKLFIQ